MVAAGTAQSCRAAAVAVTAVEAGLRQGSAGWSGHGCGKTGTQGTKGRG